METATIILIALGLSMDAFAVSVASGFTLERIKLKPALKMAAFFGIFQFLMPILGWLAGMSVRSLITGVDHWIAFALLSAVGGKMIYESVKIREKDARKNPFKPATLFILAIATSIDALAVGLGLSFLKVSIITPSVIIGVITFGVTFAGVLIGKKLGHFFESKVELLGGIILIGIGVKILVEHLL